MGHRAVLLPVAGRLTPPVLLCAAVLLLIRTPAVAFAAPQSATATAADSPAATGVGVGDVKALAGESVVVTWSPAAAATAFDAHFRVIADLMAKASQAVAPATAAVAALTGVALPMAAPPPALPPASVLPSSLAFAGFRGYSGVFSAEVLNTIANTPGVLSVERNAPVRIAQAEVPAFELPEPLAPPELPEPLEPPELPALLASPNSGSGSGGSSGSVNSGRGSTPSASPSSGSGSGSANTVWASRQPASWGLDRIDQRALPLDGWYRAPDTAGAGVTVYTVDTGCNPTHPEMGGRARWGAVIPQGASQRDAWGHGSHTAGVIAGATVGVANAVGIVCIKAFDDAGLGSVANVLSALQWAWQDVQSRANATRRSTSSTAARSVVNMSLGGGYSTALNSAATAMSNAGVAVITAAGNDGGDACAISPASAGGDVVTVSATTAVDGVPSYANGGQCVDVFAPGDNITSCWNAPASYALLSGTSVAAPHVTGVAALLLAQSAAAQGAALTPAQLKQQLLSCSTRGRVLVTGDSSSGSALLSPLTPNRLLYSCDGTADPQQRAIIPLPIANAGTGAGAGAGSGGTGGGSGGGDWIGSALRSLFGPAAPFAGAAGAGEAAGAGQQTAPGLPPVKGASFCAFGVCVNF